MTLAALHQLFLKFPKISTDTRKIEANSLFFALKGDNFNGNAYAAEALKKGAAFAIIDEQEYDMGAKTILVDDVLKCLQSLSSYHRQQCKAKVIGLTGSNGKTTTKELIHAVLAKKYLTIATKGNLNNHIGVPLTLLSITSKTEFAIVEMGANHLYEIKFLCSLAQPDFGYITNFGKAHLEGFGSEQGVIQGKSELYEYLIADGKSIFMNADDQVQLTKLGAYINKFGFSTAHKEYYKIEFLGARPFVGINVENTNIQTRLIGHYNFTNCCAAILIGKYFNVPLTDIRAALESYEPSNNRSQILEKNGHRIILDAYNANPNSMRAALESFSTMEGKYKIAFLGDMFELGTTAAVEHQQIADLAAEMHFDKVYLVGKNFDETNTKLERFASFENLSNYLKQHPLKKGTLLIKGSRGMALERVLELL